MNNLSLFISWNITMPLPHQYPILNIQTLCMMVSLFSLNAPEQVDIPGYQLLDLPSAVCRVLLGHWLLVSHDFPPCGTLHSLVSIEDHLNSLPLVVASSVLQLLLLHKLERFLIVHHRHELSLIAYQHC